MKVRIAAKYLVTLGLLLSPLNGVIEYFDTFALDLRPLLNGKFMWLEKGIKDGLLALLLLLTFSALANRAKARFEPLFLALAGWVALAFCLTLAQNPVFALIGARALLPGLMFLVGAVLLREEDLTFIAQALAVVMAILIPIALIQFVFGSTIYDFDGNGRTLGLFASRIFATFCMPGSFGIFLVTFIMFSVLSGGSFTPVLSAVAAGLIFLTGSGMSFVAVTLFALSRLFKRIRGVYLRLLLLAAVPAALPFVIISGYHAIPVITGRANIWESPRIRLAAMTSHFTDSGVIDVAKGQGLGFGTNAAFNLLPAGSSMVDSAFIPDSLYLSLFSQVGLIGGLLFIALNLKIYLSSTCRYKAMIPILMFTGLTMNLLELFPVNWLYMLVLGVCSNTVARREPAREERPVHA